MNRPPSTSRSVVVVGCVPAATDEQTAVAGLLTGARDIGIADGHDPRP